MPSLEQNWDVIIIGSGLGGLSAGATLSKRGKKVLVLEKHVFAGGYAHHFPRRVKGTRIIYDFDVALHQTGDLKPGRFMSGALEQLGVLRKIQLNQFDIAYRSVGPDHDFEVPAEADDYERKLTDAYPHESRGIKDMFAFFHRIDQGKATQAEIRQCGEVTAEAFCRGFVSDERVIAIICTLWGYVGVTPNRMAASNIIGIFNHYHHGGCFYVKGGGQALSDAFISVIEECGGKVRRRNEVKSILTNSNGAAIGVETAKGKIYYAPIVISNAASQNTFNKLLDKPELAESDAEVSDSLPISTSISQAYVGIRGDASILGLPDRGRFVEPTYDYESEWTAIREGNPAGHQVIINNHNLADPGHHPKGRSILHSTILSNGALWMNLDKKDYKARKRELESHLIDQLERAIPDVRERIEVCETGTPHTMARYTQNPEGSVYGYSSELNSHASLPPDPDTTVPGLYLASVWSRSGHGFAGAMGSGLTAAGLVLREGQ
mgnify:CR=1 FL=1